MSRARWWLAAVLFWRCAAAAACPDLRVQDAWIADAPPGAAVRVGYAVLENTGSRPLTIDRITSLDFDSVEPHRMSMDRGILQMRPLPRLEVPAHGRLVLQSGGDHLMLNQPHRALAAGASSTLVFRCGTVSSSASFSVRGPAP